MTKSLMFTATGFLVLVLGMELLPNVIAEAVRNISWAHNHPASGSIDLPRFLPWAILMPWIYLSVVVMLGIYLIAKGADNLIPRTRSNGVAGKGPLR